MSSSEQSRDPVTPQTNIDFVQSSPDSPIHAERKWSPAPTSIEEAAALLGTSITRINNELIYRVTPAPSTLHSSFSTVKPVPCSELYVRLQALKYLLEQQITDDQSEVSHVDCVVGIIPLLHKLLLLSSTLSNKEIYLHSSHETLPDVHPLVNIVNNAVAGSTSSSHSNHNNNHTNVHTNKTPTSHNIKVPPVRITPPLASVPIRNAWIETLTLVHKLAPPHKLPSTNPLTLLSMYFEYAASHPKSSKSKGGVRVACLGLLGSIASDKILAPKYTRAIFADLVTLGNNGLKSSGAGDVVHRISSIKCVQQALIGWRDSSLTVRRKSEGNGRDAVFISTNRLEERILGDCVKLVKKASDDKYAEVRQAGAEFAAILSTMLIPDHRGTSSHAPSSRKEVNCLSYMDEVMAICLRNLDDESFGVSVAWSDSLARCICTAVEYYSLQNTSSTTGNSGESTVHTSSSNGLTSNVSITPGKNDFASKFKAFHDARKAVNSIASLSCYTLESAMTFIVQHFVKVGGDGAARMGGSYSMGGRHVRVGLGLVLVYLCRMQLESGYIGISSEIDSVNPSDILKIIMEMVGQGIGGHSVSVGAADSVASRSDLDDGIFDVTLSPRRKNILADKTSSMGGLLKNISGEPRHKHPFDVNVARATANRVLRRGLTENMSESMQLAILRDLVTICKKQESIENSYSYNRHQIEVALIEISNLVNCLGEACASNLGELLPVLLACINDAEHGIRHEAAVAFQAVVVNFPSAGRKHIMTAIGEIQVHYDEILALGASSHMIQSPSKEGVSSRRGRRKASTEPAMIDSNIEKSREHQYCIHGNALLLSLILQVLPKLSGGLPSELLDIILAVADNLISCQGSAKLVANNPGSLILCVRSGYNIISGVLSIGPNATIPHVSTFFNIWSRSANFSDETNNKLEPHQSISCIESLLTSLVVFLQNNADLLLSVPDALSRATQILEKIFPIISGYSQINNGDAMSFPKTRLESAKAAIMEAFAWLPPGSFPLVANSVFSFASRQIQVESKDGTKCTILPGMLSSEDDLLEYRLSTQVNGCGQFRMAELEENLEFLNSACIGMSEREAVIHLLINQQNAGMRIGSRSTSVPRCQQNSFAPTSLHAIGSWLPPPAPSRCAKERLLNISVHLFSSLFGLQGGRQQTSSVTMLKELMMSRVGSGLEDRCAINVASALLSCLKMLPSKNHPNKIDSESNHPWMIEAASAFLTLLPLPNGRVRRAAAEGLSLIASQGDTNRLHSSILRSLENVMATESFDATQANASVPTSQSTFAGCLLTFGCIQRASSEIHALSTSEDKVSDASTKLGGSVPTMLMLTRLLPHIATHRADEESFFCRTFALQSFSLLLSHSKIVDNPAIDSSERAHVLFKAVEVVESNFYTAWMTNSIEVDTKGIEDEKMAFEPTLLAVLIRLMTYLIPRLYLIQEHDGNVASRFCSMTECMLQLSNYHPGVVVEALSFLESLSSHKKLLSTKALSIPGTGIPGVILRTLSKHIFEFSKPKLCLHSSNIFRARGSNILRDVMQTYFVLLQVPQNDIMIFNDDNDVTSDLIEMLEVTLGSVTFSLFHIYRDMAFDRMDDRFALLFDLRSAIELVFKLKTRSSTSISQTIILCKRILQGETESYESDTRSEISSEIRGTFRWQTRYVIAELLCISIMNLTFKYDDLHFHSKWLISTACSLSVSTSDESELFSLQNSGINMICSLLQYVDQGKNVRESIEEKIAQILPSVRQALSYKAVDEDDSIDKEGARLVHFSGCNCLSLLYNGGMIHDLPTYKRLAKMLFPFIESCEFSSYPEGENGGVKSPYLKPKSFVDDRTSILLPRISALSALSRIYLATLLDPNLKQIFFEFIDDEISKSNNGIVTMSAALAIDGCRLKMYSENPDELVLESGLTFHNLQDIDTVTKNALIQSCSSLACFASILSISRLSTEPHETTDYPALITWTRKTISVVQSEFYSTLRLLVENPNNVTTIETFKNILEALKSVVLFRDEELMSIECIVSISKCVFQLLKFPVSGSDASFAFADDLQSEENNVNSNLNIKEPSPCSETIQTSNKEALSIDTVVQACSFVESVCRSKYLRRMNTAIFLEELFRPFVVFQKYSDISLLNNSVNATIFESFIRGLTTVLSETSEFENIIKSLLSAGLQTYQLLYETANFPTCLSELIKFCLSHDAISMKEKMLHAVDAAKNENWDLWELFIEGNPSIFSGTVIHMKNAIADHKNAERHLGALLVASKSLKSNTDMIPIFMVHVGPHMLEIFHLYGINTISGQHRTLACATCMKIIMLAQQYLSSTNTEEEDTIMFLVTVFDVFTGIVSHNGLPNQEVFNNGSDPSLGRMCAQFFVHVLRASPTTFKACMCRLKEEAKLILESTVRADMTGYPPKEPVKKKLNLKSFKRI